MLKEKKLSAGIQKFLEQRKKEEEEQAEIARRKKQELVARRDPKEQRKIEKSLKVIKSSQKFFSGESIEDNTADLQPDEDDYGYTSTISDQFHKKLMEKYHSMPEQKKFSSSSAKHKAMSKEEMQRTKDRVKNSFTTPEEDQQQIRQPQHRTSRIKVEKDSKLRAGTLIEKKPFDKPKPKLKAAPIVDFQQLMKLAEQKQHEEITIEVKEKKEPERLLTQKEKREQEELEAARKAKMKPNRIPKLGAIPRVGDSSKQDKNNNDNSVKKSATSQFAKPLAPSARPQLNNKRPAAPASTNNNSKLRDALQQRPNGDSSKPTNHKVPNSSKLSGTPSSSSSKYRETPPMKSAINNRPSSSSANSKQEKPRTPAASTSKVSDKPRDFPPKDLLRTREFPPKDLMRSREFPPKDLMRSREFPPRDVMRRKENSKQLSQQQISRKRKFPLTTFNSSRISQFLLISQVVLLMTKRVIMIPKWTISLTMVKLTVTTLARLRKSSDTTSQGKKKI